MPFHGVPQKLARNSTALLLLAILCFGALLRIGNLHNEQARHDELTTLRYLQAPSLGEYLELCRTQNPIHPPLYMVCQFYWSRVFGAGEYATRMLSIVAGMLSLGIIFLLARELYGDLAGLVAALWLAFIPFHIYHAQDIRFYAFMTLFALLSMYIFLKLLQDGRKRWWVLLSVVDLAIVWNQPMGASLFLAQAVYLLIFYRKHVALLTAWASQHIVIAATLIPWGRASDLQRSTDVLKWLGAPKIFGRGTSVEFFMEIAAGRLYWLPNNVVGKTFITYKPFLSFLLVLTYFVAVAYIIRVVLREKSPVQKQSSEKLLLPPHRSLVFLLTCLVIPPTAHFVLSYLWRPCFIHRYLIHSMLPLYILMGAFVALLGPRARVYALSALLVLNLGYQAAFHFPGPYRHRYEEAAAIIAEAHTAPERVIVLKGMDASGLRWGLRHDRIPVFRLKAEPLLMAELDALGEDFMPRWIVLTNLETMARVVSQCEKRNRPCTVFDLTSSLPLAMVYVQPPGAS